MECVWVFAEDISPSGTGTQYKIGLGEVERGKKSWFVVVYSSGVNK